MAQLPPQPIIDETPRHDVAAELTPQRFLRSTNKGGNEIYVVDGREAPAVMREVGRLREIAFRSAGGGTGLDCDVDEYDTMAPPCRQLIVWDPESQMILGGYRFIIGEDIRTDANGHPRIATSHMFDFSKRFLEEMLPVTLELGRSFVRVGYQSSKTNAKTIYALDNLWDGLGALTVVYPQLKYLFGKVTMYPSYPKECRDMILYFMNTHFPDPDNLVKPYNPLRTDMDLEGLARLFPGHSFAEDYRTLNTSIRLAGTNIPPLVNAYMSLSPTMRCFGTAINDLFGDVEETGIFFSINEIYDSKKQRHIATFDANACGIKS